MFEKFLQEIKNNKSSYFVSFLVINISVTLLLFFAFIYFNLYLFSQKTAQSLAVTIYLKPDLEEKVKLSIQKKIKNLPGIENIKLIKSEQVLAKLQEIFKGTPEILEELDLQNIPSFIEITFKNPLKDFEKAKPYLKLIEKEEGVLKVRYEEGWLGRINNFAKSIKLLTILGIGLMIVSLIFLMSITITLILERQREEIEILSLLGATPGYIAKPKVLVSFFIGISSSLLSLGILLALKNYLERSLSGLLPFYKTHLILFPLKYLILGVGGIGLFCALVSWLSVRRYFS
ncbi:cell division protein FtsX [Thermosulfurimonas dismutans]|uniref:Cell division protein FtsX n=1 Tax=Thermosulfurimonas dismutans TaxID=999894 RepID=A0A179D6B8_9BACT|nr:permease-like cell division protein FtsX [Thermosulfurimonas dismutans]OAQ21158.1 Cell division protein FtsX [Thermosulfurimonas dismutans]